MPALNWEYNETQARAIKGAVADMRKNVMRSLTNEDATLTGFGVAVFQGTNDKGATKTGTGNAFKGVTSVDRSAYTDEMLTEEGFRQYDEMLVMTEGPIWVTAGVDVDAGEDAYVTAAGVFTNVVDTNTKIGQFDTTAASGDLVKLYLK